MPTYGLINLLYYVVLPHEKYARLEIIWEADHSNGWAYAITPTDEP